MKLNRDKEDKRGRKPTEPLAPVVRAMVYEMFLTVIWLLFWFMVIPVLLWCGWFTENLLIFHLLGAAYLFIAGRRFIFPSGHAGLEGLDRFANWARLRWLFTESARLKHLFKEFETDVITYFRDGAAFTLAMVSFATPATGLQVAIMATVAGLFLGVAAVFFDDKLSFADPVARLALMLALACVVGCIVEGKLALRLAFADAHTMWITLSSALATAIRRGCGSVASILLSSHFRCFSFLPTPWPAQAQAPLRL